MKHGGKPPRHRSLLVRLLAMSTLVAVCAIVATAWFTVRSTTSAIVREQGQSLSADADVYRTLLGYAATHPRWDGVGNTLTELSRKTDRRITLLTADRQLIAESGGGPSLKSAQPSAIVDPLQVDSALAASETDASGIDLRAVGPYRITDADRSRLQRYAEDVAACVSSIFYPTKVTESPSGRPLVPLSPSDSDRLYGPCRMDRLLEPTASEKQALARLTELLKGCLKFTQYKTLSLAGYLRVVSGPVTPGEQDCVREGRRTQLLPYVAPPALLFVTDPNRAVGAPNIDLSRSNIMRIAAGTGLVLALAVAVTVIVGTRLVRPLRLLTDAARHSGALTQPVQVTTHDEIGVLATALNDQAVRREQLEYQRVLLDQQRKSMFSDVAHELRTPLTNIRSWLEAAQDGVKPTDSQLVDLLFEEAVLLQHIIDDLRDLAAADAGNLRIHPERTYVNDLLTQVVEAHRGAAERTGVALAALPDGDPQLDVDPVRFRQLVSNLVSNAVRHTPPGGSVTLRTAMVNSRFVIDVVDTGIGISTADLPKVFDRFWRADNSRTRSTGGSGLGLAIVRKLTEAHGGEVSVTSQEGVGTTFTVRIPF